MTPAEQLVLVNQLYAEGVITFVQLAVLEIEAEATLEPTRAAAFARWLEAIGDRTHDRQRGRLKGQTQ